jgi:NitT/TauT family transport system permease protein
MVVDRRDHDMAHIPEAWSAEAPAKALRGAAAHDDAVPSSKVWQFVRAFNWPLWTFLLVLVAVWQIWGAAVSPLILAPPSAIVARLIELWRDANLALDIQTSAIEFALGFLVAALVGVVIGLLSGNIRMISRIIDPLISAIYAMPTIALAPLFIILLGIGIASKVVVVALACFFPIVLTTIAGVRSIDRNYWDVGRVFRLTTLQAVMKITLPSSVPFILSGLQIAVGRGLTAVLAAELFGARNGVGLLILKSSSLFDTAAVYVGILIFAFSGIVLTKFVSLLERKVAPWRFIKQ